MTKLTLTNIGTLADQNTAVAAINANFDAIEQAFENTFSRDGTTPNTLGTDLDANGKNIINAGTVNADALVLDGAPVSALQGAPAAHTHPISDVTGLQAALDGKTATGHTHTAANITDFSEAVDDRVSALVVAGTGITATYNDGANTLTIAATAASSAPVVPDQTIYFGALTAVGAGAAPIRLTSGSYTSISLGTRTVGSNHFTVPSTNIQPSSVPSDVRYVWTGCTVTGASGTSNTFTLTIVTIPNSYSCISKAEINAAVTAIGSAGGKNVLLRGSAFGVMVDGTPDFSPPFKNMTFTNTVICESHPGETAVVERLELVGTQNIIVRNIKFQRAAAAGYAGTLQVSYNFNNVTIDNCEVCSNETFDVLDERWASEEFYANYYGILVLPFATAGPHNINITNCYIHDVRRAIGVSGKGGRLRVVGNIIDRYYEQGIGVGDDGSPPTETLLAFNFISRPFSKATDINNPHTDAIFPRYATTATDVTNVFIIGNCIWQGRTRGYAQGIFGSDVASGKFVTWTVIGNLIEAGMVRSLDLRQEKNSKVIGNVVWRGGTGTGAVDGGGLYVGVNDSNVATAGVTYFSPSTTVVRDNIYIANAIQPGATLTNNIAATWANHSDYFQGLNIPYDTWQEVVAAYMPKYGGSLYTPTTKVGIAYTDFYNQIIEHPQD